MKPKTKDLREPSTSILSVEKTPVISLALLPGNQMHVGQASIRARYFHRVTPRSLAPKGLGAKVGET